MTMRAARFEGSESGLVVREVELPTLGKDEVLIKVVCCGLCGSDLHFLEGMPTPGGVPLTLGHEASGFVHQLGEGVKNFAVGDRVALTLDGGCGTCSTCKTSHSNACPNAKLPGLQIDGAFAEFVVAPQSIVLNIPDGISFAAAAVAVDSVATPYHALKCRAFMEEGENVVVIGAGGVGSQAISMAKVLGANEIIAIDQSPLALNNALRSGATQGILVDDNPNSKVREILGDGATLAIDCVGKPESLRLAINTLVPGGRALALGIGMEPPPIDIPQALFALWEYSVIGSFGSHRKDVEEVFQLHLEGTIDIDSSITHRVNLEGVSKGYEMLSDKSINTQRIVMEIT